MNTKKNLLSLRAAFGQLSGSLRGKSDFFLIISSNQSIEDNTRFPYTFIQNVIQTVIAKKNQDVLVHPGYLDYS